MKRTARKMAAFFLYYSGLLWLLAEFKLRNRAVVLMYHRVLPTAEETFSHEGIIVSPRTFDMQMKFVREHFNPLTPDQFGQQLRVTGFRRRACLITFDDGWKDNHQHALPVLVRHSVPAIVFITTAFVGTETTFWQERLTRLLFNAARTRSFGVDVLRELECLDAGELPVEQAKRRVRDVVTSLKRREPEVVDRIVARLESAAERCSTAPESPGSDRFLTWTEVRELQGSKLVTIGSHAHTHRPLPILGYEGAMAEFSRSRETFQDHGIRAADMCAYPNGNVDSCVLDAARNSGFTLGFATGKGLASNADHPLQLPRINIHESSSGSNAEFLCRILGVV